MKSPLEWAIWFVVMCAVMGWLGRTRQATPSGQEPGTLRLPSSIFWIGAVVAAFFIALAILCQLYPGKTKNIGWVAAVFSGFAIMGLVMVVDYRRTLHAITPSGLRYRTLTRSGELEWSSVVKVDHSEGSMCLNLHTADGRLVRLSFMLMGLPELAKTILLNVPREMIAPGTLELLSRAEGGVLPSVWM